MSTMWLPNLKRFPIPNVDGHELDIGRQQASISAISNAGGENKQLIFW